MKKSRLLVALSACLLALSSGASASYVDNGTYTTANGLDWLDLSATANLSYDYVSTQFGAGGDFEGWSYATAAQVADFWTALGGIAPYTGSSVVNNGLFGIVAPLWGDLSGSGYSFVITADAGPLHPTFGSTRVVAYMDAVDMTTDFFDNTYTSYVDSFASAAYGSALVRTAAVPVPAAAWLFGSGLLGLVAMARRKQAA